VLIRGILVTDEDMATDGNKVATVRFEYNYSTPPDHNSPKVPEGCSKFGTTSALKGIQGPGSLKEQEAKVHPRQRAVTIIKQQSTINTQGICEITTTRNLFMTYTATFPQQKLQL
jgi:hypothetical protein